MAGTAGPLLRGERVTLRPAEPADVAALAEILHEPEVARWFGEESPDTAQSWVDDPDATTFVIELDGVVAGSIQFYEQAELEYRHAGMDIFLATAHQGRGLGPEALRLLGRYLVEERGHHRLVIDPAVANERAIKAYESVGFRPVGVMREYERGPDGTFHDGLLMDLLASELR